MKDKVTAGPYVRAYGSVDECWYVSGGGVKNGGWSVWASVRASRKVGGGVKKHGGWRAMGGGGWVWYACV